MGSGDFLRTRVGTPLREYYTVAGTVCRLTTNSQRLLEAARGSFLPSKRPSGPVDLSLRFWVDDDDGMHPPWPKPYARGLDELVFVGLDSRSSMLADLRRRRVIGRFSPSLAADTRYWRTVIFPMMVSIVSGSIGLVELHASCVAGAQQGLVLIGPSRSGKSTLAMTLVKAGFRLLSDDRVFLSVKNGQLLAFGLSRPLKIRREAALWFEQFRDQEPTDCQGGESVYYWEPTQHATQQALLPCEPQVVVFLERREAASLRVAPMDPADIKGSIEEDVMAEAPRAMETQQRTIDALLARPCWRLQYGGVPPQVVAERIVFLLAEFERSRSVAIDMRTVTKCCEPPSIEPHSDGAGKNRRDLLHRFTETPHAVELRLMQRTIRLEANEKSTLDLAFKFFARHQHGNSTAPEFRWRIVTESDPRVQSTAVPLSAFSDRGLRYVNIGQRSFLAVDLDRCEGVSFLAESFVEGEARLKHRPPLDILFCMTAASLGLTALSGGCVGSGDKGVMVFGPPNSGKTTASYLASKLGLEFQADQVVFLDVRGDVLRAWGDPFPAVFRPETLDFLPELRESARRSTYEDLPFYYYDKAEMQSQWANPVIPVCSVFLDRTGKGEPELQEMSKEDAASHLQNSMLFEEDPRFQSQILKAVTMLAVNPVYQLRYDSDPKIAATCIEKMLL